MSLARSVAVTTATLVLARIVALIAGIATISLASRYLGVGHFGALTAAMAYASIFAVLTDLGISTVATREIARAPDRERQILGNVISVGYLSAVAAAGLGVLAMFVVYPGGVNSATRLAIAILLIQTFMAPVSGAARAHFTARQRGHVIAAGDLALAVGMAVFTALAVSLDLGYLAVVSAVAFGYVAQAAVMGGLALRAGGLGLAADVPLAVMLFRSALPLGGTLILNYLYFRLDILLLSWLKSDVDVAHYGLAYRVLEGLMVVPGYVMLGLFPEIARREHDRVRLRETIGVALAGMEAIAIPAAALLAIFAPEICLLLGGHKYDASAPVLAILAAALAISYINGVYGNALMALGRQRVLFLVTVGPLAVNALLNLVLIPPLNVIGAAIAVVVSEAVAFVLVRRVYIRVAGAPAPAPHLRLLAAGLAFGALAGVKFSVGNELPPGALIVVGGAAGILVYSGLLLVLRAIPEPVLDWLPLPARPGRSHSRA